MTPAGRCQCGDVRFEVRGRLRAVWDCHCERCRRFTGHHMAATSAATDDVVLHDDTGLRWYQPAPGVRYGFCGRCGSSLFWCTDAAADRLSICAGVLDQPTGLVTERALWVAEAGDYHRRDPRVVEHAYEVPEG